jgi:hypothetical protein
MIKFERHPEIAITAEEWASGRFKTWYTKDYDAIFAAVAKRELDEKGVLRSLFANDLWFLIRYGFGIEKADHPFVVKMCRMVEEGSRTDTLDIWARFHWKSTIITQAETLQFEIKNPEKCTGIFCYARPAAKKPLRSLKVFLEESELLRWCFPEVLWERPDTQAPKWSEDEGLVFKRSGSSRRESSIEAHGLIEGMPTGSHFERNVLDDLETEDIRESPDMLAKVFSKAQMALVNLATGADTDQTRIIGTYYSHFGPNIKLRDLKYDDGRPIYELRLVSATEDGTRDGKPVWFDPISWEKAKKSAHFNSQQLCNPTPESDIKLDKRFLRPINRRLIPSNIFRFLVIDQAGGDETDKQSKDMWNYCVLGIKPEMDEIGQSNVYILDVEADQMSHAEGIDGIVRMYLRNGVIMQLGVEKVGMSTTEIHITNALRAHGRNLSLNARNLVLLKPAGRSKVKRVESALQWPLNNGKLFYADDIPSKYIDAIMEEMDKFPLYHVDILDGIAYGYDMFKEFKFTSYLKQDNTPEAQIVKMLQSRQEEKYDPLTFGMEASNG